MLPDELVGTYQQYKKDTKTFASWLIVTARTSGYVSESIPAALTQTDHPLSDSTNKRKARAQEKGKEAAREESKEPRKFVVSLDEFLPLSKYIVSNLRAPSKVPSSILSLLKQSIKARADIGDWFKENTQEDDNGSHLHFIHILQEVYDTLHPFGASGDSDKTTEQKDIENLANTFNNLEVEVPSQHFLEAPAKPQKDYKNAQILGEVFELLTGRLSSSFDKHQAASIFFRDVNKICRHVEQTWKDFKDGKINVMNAAVVSNAAVELVRRLEETLFKEFPEFRKIDEALLKGYKKYNPKLMDAQQLINVMFRATCGTKNKLPMNDNSEDALFNLELFEDARYYFLDMHSILLTYYISSQKGSKCVYTPMSYGHWEPDSGYHHLNATQRHHQDRRILLELLPDILLTATSTSGIPPLAEDELLRGSRNVFAGSKGSPIVHVWMLVSLRIFCDIHHILGSDIGNSFEAVRNLSCRASDTIDTYLTRRQDEGTECWPKDVDECIKTTFIDRMQRSLFVDEAKDFIDNSARNVKGWKGKKSFELLRRHPWACGLMEMSIYMSMKEIGLLTINMTHSVLGVAHLYNALQMERLLTAAWSDMDIFLEILGDDQIFKGSRPSNLEEYGTRLTLLRGISAETFARNRRDRGMIYSRRGNRYLFPENDLLHILMQRYFLVLYKPATKDDEISPILHNMEEILNREIGTISNESYLTAYARSDIGRDQSQKQGKKQQSKLDPVEVLMALQFALARALPTIMFDYLALHKCCSEVVETTHGICAPLLESEMPVVFRDIEQICKFGPGLSIDFALIMGTPIKTATQMISKTTMPNLPPMIHASQQKFDQRAILTDFASAIDKKIADGDMSNEQNLQVRRLMDEMPRVFQFKIHTADTEKKLITFKKGRMMQHTSSKCTRSHCVCATKGVPILIPGWKRGLSKLADDMFGGKDLKELAERKQ